MADKKEAVRGCGPPFTDAPIGSQREHPDVLQNFVVFREVVATPAAQHLKFRGEEMVLAVFEGMQTDLQRLLPSEELAKFFAAASDLWVTCDYAAAMTKSRVLTACKWLFASPEVRV